MTKGNHTVQIYVEEPFLLDELTEFVGSGIAAGEGVVVIATAAHRAALLRRLRRSGIDTDAETRANRLFLVDAEETLARFTEGPRLIYKRFVETVAPLLAQAAGGHRGVRAFGEMVSILRDRGEPQAALRLEEMWDALRDVRSFDLLCAYPLRSFGGPDGAAALRKVCNAHEGVIPAETYPSGGTPEERAHAVVALQQRVAALESPRDEELRR